MLETLWGVTPVGELGSIRVGRQVAPFMMVRAAFCLVCYQYISCNLRSSFQWALFSAFCRQGH